MKESEIPFGSPKIKKDMTLKEGLELLNECGTNIESQHEEIVLNLINNAIKRLESLEILLEQLFQRGHEQKDCFMVRKDLYKQIREMIYKEKEVG